MKSVAILLIIATLSSAEDLHGAYGHAAYGHALPLAHGHGLPLAHGHGLPLGHGHGLPLAYGHGHGGALHGHAAYAPYAHDAYTHGYGHHAVPVVSAYSTLTKHVAPVAAHYGAVAPYGLAHGHGYAGHLPAFAPLAHGHHGLAHGHVDATPVAHVAKVEKTVVAPAAYAHPLAHGYAGHGLHHGAHLLGGHVAAYSYGAYGHGLGHAPLLAHGHGGYGHGLYGHGFGHKSKA